MLAKVANKIIIGRLRKRLEQAKGLWANELHAVLWAYHTTPNSSTKETPYRLVYGSDIIILIELIKPSSRRTTMIGESNELAQRVELDLAEEDSEKVRVKEKAIKQQIVRKYNKKVIPWEFEEGDLVLRKVELQRKSQGKGKLAPNWEGPYRVTRIISKRAYQIAELEKKRAVEDLECVLLLEVL